MRRRSRVAAARARPARETMRRSPVGASILRGRDGVAQCGYVAQSEVHALPGQRMHDMRGIANSQYAAGDVGIGELPAQREGDAPAEWTHVAEAGGECEPPNPSARYGSVNSVIV